MKRASYYYIDGLKSERLETKFLEPDDWKYWAKYFERDGGRFSKEFDKEKSEMKAKMWINHQLSRYQDQSYGMQWIIHRETSERIGQCGLLLQNIDRVMELEIVYHTFPEYWGNGYATEAAKLFRDFGFRSLPIRSIISLVDPKNFSSHRVAERNGMIRGAFRKWKGVEYYVYRITRKDWEEL
ncbi:GNAT family N-acetyltransferase [Reichenbachiella versicolor]|uniref:GNAT family N-acetyltransferase n=1 Tax=Reichenbachiella versicolor TaxID=1821036 RepID=UPI000D6E0C2D|nr:GNAT family N-acetyltransferase [Reichenbachiella versicolor]